MAARRCSTTSTFPVPCVGWFTCAYPVILELDSAEPSSSVEALLAIKEQLRRIPSQGIGYGLLRYLSGDEETRARLRGLAEPEVSFNYLGRFDPEKSESSLLLPTEESADGNRSPSFVRHNLLEVTGMVLEGKLIMTWTYSENVHRSSTIESLAESYMAALQALIDHSCSVLAGS